MAHVLISFLGEAFPNPCQETECKIYMVKTSTPRPCSVCGFLAELKDHCEFNG